MTRAPALTAALLASALWLATPAAARTPWPEVPVPPKAQTEWVAEETVINGLPSRIESFDSQVSVAEMLAYYRAHWAHSREGAAREAQMGGWKTLTTLQGPFQIVLQVQAKPDPKRGSIGLLSVANFGEARKDFYPKNFPQWGDARTIQVMESVDGPRRSQYVVLSSREGVDFNVRRARDEWQRRGFELVRQTPMPTPDQATWMASFNRGNEQLDITVGRQAKARRATVTTHLTTPVTP